MHPCRGSKEVQGRSGQHSQTALEIKGAQNGISALGTALLSCTGSSSGAAHLQCLTVQNKPSTIKRNRSEIVTRDISGLRSDHPETIQEFKKKHYVLVSYHFTTS